MFANLPNNEKERNQQTKSLFEEIIADYLYVIGKVTLSSGDINHGNNDNLLEWDTIILTVIDFLISTQNFDYLFIQMKNIFNEFGQKNNFIKNLEPFILKNRIKIIPNNETFKDIIHYYQEKNKLPIIQQLIFHLDINSIDVEYFINLCLERQLHTASMYICTSGRQSNFVQPLQNLFDEYNRIRFDFSDNNPNNQGYGMVDRVDSFELGYKCLWFIDLVFKRKIFPNLEINTKIWRIELIEIIIWMLDIKNMKALLDLDTYLVFTIFERFFDPEISDIIIKSKDQILKSASISNVMEYKKHILQYKFEHLNESRKKLFIDSESIDKSIVFNIATIDNSTKRMLCDILSIIYCCCYDIKEWQVYLYYLVAHITLLFPEYKLLNEIKKETIRFIFENPRIIASWDNYKSKTISSLMCPNLKDYDIDIISAQEYDEFRGDYLMELITSLDVNFSKDENILYRNLAANTP